MPPASYDEVEYLELRAHHDLSLLSAADRPARLIVAAWLGETRLIDNWGRNKSSAKSCAKGERIMNSTVVRLCSIRSLWIAIAGHQF